jgi:aminomethyltransferase
MEKQTALYQRHLAAGGKMVPFAGYILPVQYKKGIIAEHMAVRKTCGMFDVSHMGELIFEGPDALSNINNLLTNDYTNMDIGRVRYGLMCYDNGGVVDDLLVYKVSADKYFVVVNAANRLKDVAWIKAHLFGTLDFYDISDDISQIALQGPSCEEIITRLTSDIPKKYYRFLGNSDIAGIDAIISKTGYTGEKGYEIYIANEHATAVWDKLMAAGQEFGLIPCGLGARDTLRLEAGMPLYGHEMDETVTPLEAGLDFVVKLEKDFIGRDALLAAGLPKRNRVGLKVIDRGIIREHQDIYFHGEQIGHSTSGTYCPYLDGAYAMALIARGSADVGDIVEADVRGRKIEAKVVALPFYHNV